MGDKCFNIYQASDNYFENTLIYDKPLASAINSNESGQLIENDISPLTTDFFNKNLNCV